MYKNSLQNANGCLNNSNHLAMCRKHQVLIHMSTIPGRRQQERQCEQVGQQQRAYAAVPGVERTVQRRTAGAADVVTI
jgi:hypothetical protein